VNLTNTFDMILAVARAHGCAPVERIVLRPELLTRIEREDGGRHRLNGCGIPVDTDTGIPLFPGFEVHRERW
jgi:hypothetical protein